MAVHCKNQGYPNKFITCDNQLDGGFVVFLLLRSYAVAINDLQYCRDKMAENSEMFLKYGHNFFVERNTSTNTGYLEKLHHK